MTPTAGFPICSIPDYNERRIRAGETAEEIADAAGVPIERVRRFEGPVLAERAYRAQEAQGATVRQSGDSGPGRSLGDLVEQGLRASGVDPADAEWDSRKRADGGWQVAVEDDAIRAGAPRFGGASETTVVSLPANKSKRAK